jgi:hypothetical protein
LRARLPGYSEATHRPAPPPAGTPMTKIMSWNVAGLRGLLGKVGPRCEQRDVMAAELNEVAQAAIVWVWRPAGLRHSLCCVYIPGCKRAVLCLHLLQSRSNDR